MKHRRDRTSGKAKPKGPTANAGGKAKPSPKRRTPAGEMKPLSVRRCSFEVWSDGTIVGVNGSASLALRKRDGRWLVNFSRNGHKIQFMRCRLVAAAFHGGMRPQKSWWVRHLNDDPGDDRPENLVWEARKARLGRSVRARRVVVKGREMCATEAARRARKNPNDVLRSIRKGREIGQVLALPRYGHYQRRSDAILVEYEGAALSMREWAKRMGIGLTTIWTRWKKGIRGADLFHRGPLPARRRSEDNGRKCS